MLLNSLLENAVQYHRQVPGSYIKLSVHAEAQGLTFVVEDNGQGIPADLPQALTAMENCHTAATCWTAAHLSD